jgi:23S rRNA (uracil1939-C5)-methyltransferase
VKQQQISIERLAFGGNGVGRIDGKVCFVPFSAPGDRLSVAVTATHRSYLEAEILEILEPSTVRINPPCPVFGHCGGCSWQHVSYKAQCDAKRDILAENLRRLAHIEEPPVEDTIPSASQYGYRARAQFKLYHSVDGLKVGFYRRGSRLVIDLPHGCPVVMPVLNEAMSRIAAVLVSLPDIRRVPQVSLEAGEEGVGAIVHYIGDQPGQLIRHLEKARAELSLSGLFIQSGRKSSLKTVFGEEKLSYLVPGGLDGKQPMALQYGIGGFSQVNRQQNMAMVDLARGMLNLKSTERLLDLYCGNGNLSLPLSGQVKEVLGIEEYPPSIASAVDNCRQVRVNNSTFRCAEAVAEMGRLAAEGERFDAVLLDPPRAGGFEAVRMLGSLAPSRVVYVSCDPATLARDLEVLAEEGFRLERAVPIDMFPQTSHLETVALLAR